MKKLTDTKSMKFFLALLFAVCSQNAWAGIYQHGTVVRMRMAECLPSRHGFIATFGGQAQQGAPTSCPEYTLVSEKVVFVIVGSSSDQLVPLADVVDFRFHKNELAMRIDDARHEAKFSIREMILRSEWDLVQKHIQEELNSSPRATESSMMMRGGN